MSVQRHTTRLGNWLWYASVSLLVLLAIGLTTLRLLLPEVEGYRHAVEQKVSSLIGQPVAIDTIDARLLGFSPSLIINGVTLLDDSRKLPLARFKQIRIEIDLIATAFRRQLILENLTIVGAKLGVVRHENGRFELQGLNLPEGQSPGQTPLQLGNWLFSQGQVAIEGGQLNWDDRGSGQLLKLRDVDIRLENRAAQHRLQLTLKRPGAVRQELNLAFFIEGDIRDQASWHGDIYLKASHFQPVEWLSQFNLPEMQLTSAEADLELWGHWQAQQLAALEGTFNLKNLQGRYQDKHFNLQQLAARVDWQRQASGWQADLDQFTVQYANERWEPMRLALRRQDASYQLRAERIDLAPLSHLLQTLPLLGPQQRELLGQLKPRGTVAQLLLQRNGDGLVQAQGRVENAGIDEWEKIPGFDGLNGQLWWDGEAAEARLYSSKLTLHLLRLFREPIGLDEFSARLNLLPDAGGWYLTGRDLSLNNADLKAQLSVDVALPATALPFIDIRGGFRDGYGPHAGRYLPVGIMKPTLVEWLDQAFVKGRVVQGTLLFHGRPQDFPFTENNGRFQIAFEGEGVELSYFAGWPHLNDVHADVVFEGKGMRIQARSAQILHSPVDSTEVIIRDFKNARLEINAEADLLGDDALYLLRESPLAKLGGSATNGMRMQGKNHVRLALDIPLAKRLADDRPLQAHGEVTFLNSQLTLEQGLKLHNLHGKLAFANHEFSAHTIQASLLGGPVSLDVETHDGKFAQTIITGSGQAHTDQLEQELGWRNLRYFSGASAWNMTMTIPHDKSREALLSIASNLIGTEVSLPDSLAKPAETRVKLALDIILSGERQGQVDVEYGKRLVASLARDGKDAGRFSRAAFHFGGGRASLPSTPSVRVTGTLAQIHPAAWLPLFQGEKQGIDNLPVDIIMKRAHIAELPQASKDGQSKIDVEKLPNITLAIDSFALGDMELGKLHLSSVGQPGYRSLSDLRIEAADFTFKGDGWWQHTGGSSLTQLAVELHSTNVGKMLKSLGFRTMIDGATGSATGNISWPGGPLDFDLQGLNGNLDLKIENGTIVDVDPGAGRLLGLFSLYELPRRLRLDFSDFFQKGLQFSLMEGSYQLRDGSAFTRDFKTATPSATIVSVGRTGLVAKDFDQEIAVVPNVSGTLPIAGGLAWGPQVAAVLLVLQQVFKPGIEEATMSHYRVTGSWEAPKIEKVLPPKAETDS